MEFQNEKTMSDIVISTGIPITLCLVIPIMLYWVNDKLQTQSQKFYYDPKLVIFKYIIYIIAYTAIFGFYKLKNDEKSLNYIVGFLVSILCICILFIVNRLMLFDGVNVFLILGTMVSYLLMGINLKIEDSKKIYNN